MKTIVIYSSHTGFTKQYAEWLKEAINSDVCSFKELNNRSLDQYDKVIYGGSLKANRIRDLNKFRKMYPNCSNKLVVFSTGITSIEDKEKIDLMISNNQLNNIPFYYLLGGVNYEKVGWLSGKILRAVGKEAKKNGDLQVATRLEQTGDYTNKKDLTELIEFVTTH